MRKVKFINGGYYHIYNRGVDKRKIFPEGRDYVRFLRSMREFNRVDPVGSLYENYYIKKNIDKKLSSQLGAELQTHALVKILCYCLLPNHYHILLKQSVDNGISCFLHKISTSYTNYFNLKYQRSGSLFQGRFKAMEVRTLEKLINISAYINTNYKIHRTTRDLKKYPWSNYLDYIGSRNGTLCSKEFILNNFNSRKDFIIHTKKIAKNTIKDRKIKILLLE